MPALATVDFGPPYPQSLFKCPWCEEETGLHVNAAAATPASDSTSSPVLVYASGEDHLSTVHARETPDHVAPTRRRHGVSIGMWCEHCGTIGWVHFIQNKGITMVEYDDIADYYDSPDDEKPPWLHAGP